MYDIIGDIHGHATELEQLLLKMDYEPYKKGFRHPDKRTVLFVGDFIDRGLEQRRTLEIVRSMIDEEDAKAVMGNHEFNAICYATQMPNGSYARAHNSKHGNQHHRFLEAFPFGSTAYNEQISFFRSLPLWMDLPELRLVHAQWYQPWIDRLSPYLDSQNCLNDPELITIYGENRKSDEVYKAVDGLLKGSEQSISNLGMSFGDKDGNKREEARIHWWRLGDGPEKVFAIPKDRVKNWRILDQAEVENMHYKYEDSKPVFFGHYWLNENIQSDYMINPNAVCLDYSVGKGGKLVACRWNDVSTESWEWFFVDAL